MIDSIDSYLVSNVTTIEEIVLTLRLSFFKDIPYTKHQDLTIKYSKKSLVHQQMSTDTYTEFKKIDFIIINSDFYT